VLYFPYLIFPVKTTRQSGVLFPYLGYSSDKLGFDVEVPVFWAISDSTDATFYQRYMTRGGTNRGRSSGIFSPDTFGTFYADYLDDKWTGQNETDEIGKKLDRQAQALVLLSQPPVSFQPRFLPPDRHQQGFRQFLLQ